MASATSGAMIQSLRWPAVMRSYWPVHSSDSPARSGCALLATAPSSRAAETGRSRMNVTFRLPEEAMENEFVSRAAAEGMVELAGHRSVGGIRASIYNAVPVEAVRALRSFMERFRAATP